jgi:hypothetical protein
MKYVDLPHGNAALAIFPSVVGFGWMLFEGPLWWVDSGMCTLAKGAHGCEQKNARCIKRVEKLLNEYHPAFVVLEAFEGPGSKRDARIKALCRSIVSVATMNGVKVHIISRDDIERCFVSRPAKTRYEVAEIAASYVSEIAHLLPHKRKTYETEFPNMALFACAALLIVHYANPAEPL